MGGGAEERLRWELNTVPFTFTWSHVPVMRPTLSAVFDPFRSKMTE
jgi:hypothetical protein